MTSFETIGQRTIREIDRDKVTGQAAFGDDVTLPGTLHGLVLRSPHAHAKILSIDTRRALKVKGVKAVVTSLIQAERYGTPLGTALRVLAQENRDMRMAEAERKAAALPPKLTVPMITFFLPVIFVVILGPAVIEVMAIE